MIEIKFRAWDKKKRKMIYPSGLSLKDWINQWSNKKYINSLEFEMFTSLKDKNGNEIYAGDIVVKDNGIYQIRYSQHSFDLASDVTSWPKREDGFSYYGCNWSDIEIIGNVHEEQK